VRTRMPGGVGAGGEKNRLPDWKSLFRLFHFQGQTPLFYPDAGRRVCQVVVGMALAKVNISIV